jgi:hypothetical protein
VSITASEAVDHRVNVMQTRHMMEILIVLYIFRSKEYGSLSKTHANEKGLSLQITLVRPPRDRLFVSNLK